MLTLALVFAAAVVLGVDGQTTDYSTVCAAHTMAIYPPLGPACNGYTGSVNSGVSTAEIATILARHNELRRRVAEGNELQGAPGPQPNAANMAELKWDAELAMIAQRWASQCTYTHDTCRNVTRFKSVGQNIHKSSAGSNDTTHSWNDPTNAWYNEVAVFDKSNVNSFVFSTAIGHYSQVVWANTSLIGCGYQFYKSNLAGEAAKPFIKISVCNYAKAGNFGGQPVYKTGTPCSQCPAGTTCSNSLCV